MQLTTPPVIYCAVVNSFMWITSVEENDQSSFEYLFKMLARKGIFLDECDDMIITGTTLSVQNPFNMVSIIHTTIYNETCIPRSPINKLKLHRCIVDHYYLYVTLSHLRPKGTVTNLMYSMVIHFCDELLAHFSMRHLMLHWKMCKLTVKPLCI